MPATLGNPLFLSWMYLHTGRNEDLSFLRILMDYSISSFDFIYYSSIAVVPHSRNFTPMFRKHVFPPTDRRYLAIFCEIPHRIILFSSIFNSYELKILVDLSSRTTYFSYLKNSCCTIYVHSPRKSCTRVFNGPVEKDYLPTNRLSR